MPELTDEQMAAQEAARARLEAEVERRRSQPLMRDRSFASVPKAVENRKPTGILTGIVLDVLQGCRRFTDEELAAESAYAKASNPEVAGQAAKDRAEAKRRNAWEAICPPEYREPFDFSQVRSGVDHAELRKILDWPFGAKGLYIFGSSGRSKTRAVYARLARAHFEERLSVLAIEGVQFGNEAAAAFYDSLVTEKWLKRFTSVDILFLDDAGKRFTPSTQEALFTIAERRTNQRRPILITINYTGDDLRKMAVEKGGAERLSIVNPFLRRIEDFTEIVKP
jgi:DNA replication protein DnaC